MRDASCAAWRQGAIALGLLLAGQTACTQDPEPSPPPAPPLDLPAALAQAAQTGKPVLVQFAADWIESSAATDRMLREDETCRTAMEPFLHARVEVPAGSAGRAVIDAHRVTAVPCWILLAPDGQEVARASPLRFGERPERALIVFLGSEAVRAAVVPSTPAEAWAHLRRTLARDGPSPDAIRRLHPLVERLEGPAREEAQGALQDLRENLETRLAEARAAQAAGNGGALGEALTALERFALTDLREAHEEEIAALRGSSALETHIAGQIARLADPDWETRIAAREALRAVLPLVRDRVAALRDSPDAETAFACADLLRVEAPPVPRVRLRIREVVAGSQGEAAGVRPGDIILAHGDRAIRLYTEIATAVNTTDPSERIMLRIERDGRPLDIELHGGRIGVNPLEEVEE
ncbi:MAG: thioredoxin family protein [Planctomycetes bacterium]|nr:thioredoxin family protein [Planctomycetota bacterium]